MNKLIDALREMNSWVYYGSAMALASMNQIVDLIRTVGSAF